MQRQRPPAPNTRLTMAVKAHHLHLLHIRNRSEDMATNYAPNTNANTGSRKRPRDMLCELNTLHMNQEVFEINQIILQHMEKARIEMVELSRRQINRIYMAIGAEISKNLKWKNEEMERMAQANRFLEEKINNVAMEAQIWRELAQSNEAAANMFRASLEDVLAKRREEKEEENEAESCCSGGEKEEEEEEEEEEENELRRISLCRYCRAKVASVLFLPCQHLCLCDSCGVNPMVLICPACGADRAGLFNINFA